MRLRGDTGAGRAVLPGTAAQSLLPGTYGAPAAPATLTVQGQPGTTELHEWQYKFSVKLPV